MKAAKTMAMMIISCVLMAGTASADDPSLYYSLHDKSQLYYYCSKDSNLGGILQLPCNSPYPYYNEAYYTGIKDRLNPDDMKVMCHLNPADAATCANMTQTTFDFGGVVTPSNIISKFRLFIPPGTVNVTVQYYVSRDAQIAVLSRFGQPPTGGIENYPPIGINPEPFPLSDYWSAEHAVINTEGLITPISNDSPDNVFLQSLTTTAGNTGGGWLYMKVLPYTNSSIQFIKFTLTVKLDIYRAWYNKVNAVSGYWDAMGNPPPIMLACTPPSASFTASANGEAVPSGASLTISAGQTVNFNSSSVGTVSWNFGDTASADNTASGANASHTYNNAGKYAVTMTVPNGTCSSSAILNIIVNSAFVCDMNGDDKLGLEEVIYILQMIAELRPADNTVVSRCDINGDDKLGLEEVIYMLQVITGLRP